MTLYQFFQKAEKGKWAIGQFNFSSLEQLKGIILAASNLHSPVILGTSEGEMRFLGVEEMVALVRAIEKKVGIQFFLHLDHGSNLSYIEKAIKVGYDSVHFDGSLLDFSDNLKRTKKIVAVAHRKGVMVEGELGCLRGESMISKERGVVKELDLTIPEQAEEFVRKTKVDSLAVAVGNIHGIYAKMPELDFKRLRAIKEKTNGFLVLHGGSGISDGNIKKAIQTGIQKININTALRAIWKKELRKELSGSETLKPYLILTPVIEKIQKKVEIYIKLFRSNNKS